MTRSRISLVPIAVGVFALGVVFSGLWLLRADDHAVADSRPRPLTCKLTVGQTLGFRIDTTTVGAKPDESSPQRAHLDGQMWWHVLAREGASWVVSAVFDPISANGVPVDNTVDRPLLVRVGNNCGFRELAFDPTQTESTRTLLRGVLSGVEIILSPMPSAQWVSRHRDALGAFDATYRVVPQSNDGVVVTRERTRYDASSLPTLPPALGGRLRVEILASEAHATIDTDGGWLRALSSHNKLRLRAGGNVVSEIETHIQLTALPPSDMRAKALADVDRERFVWLGMIAAPGRTELEPPPVDEHLAAMNVDGALADFIAFLGDPSLTDGLSSATGRLAGYLRAHPEALADILTRMRAGSLDDKLHAPLFLAFEKTGTSAASRALQGALEDRGLTAIDRMRAAAALQDIRRPDERTADALIEQARANRGDSIEQPVVDAARLALGALSQRARTDHPAVAHKADAYLRDALTRTDDPQATAVLLDAIGNTGASAFTDVLAPYADDSSPLLRARAASAYRGMDREVMAPVLATWLQHEHAPLVRRAIGESLATRFRNDDQPASTAVVAAVAGRLATESDAQARAAYIALLGSAATTDASARAALIAQFTRETVVELKVLIGRYVSAEDLRS